MTHADHLITLAERIDYLERLLSRAYPWLHNPYHRTSDYANWAEGDAVIEEVQTVIQHVPDQPDPLLKLPCGSCDGDGCPNCGPRSAARTPGGTDGWMRPNSCERR